MASIPNFYAGALRVKQVPTWVKKAFSTAICFCPRWECPADYAISSGEFGMWPEWSMRGVG